MRSHSRRSAVVALALVGVATGAACRAARDPDAYPNAEQRAVLERYRADCRRAHAIVARGPSSGSVDPEFGGAVGMLPCSDRAADAASIVRAWRDAPADGSATEVLVGSSMRVGGQAVFRAALQVARDSTRDASVRLAAFRVLASYVDAHATFRLPADGPLLHGAVDHPAFAWHEPYEAFAPDTVMAALQALASSESDPVVRGAAAFVRRSLSSHHASGDAQLAEAARRNRVAARATGCWVIGYDERATSELPNALRGRTDTIELRDEPDRHQFGRARVLRVRSSDARGGWDERGPDSVAVHRHGPPHAVSVVFAVDAGRARVTVDDGTRGAATVGRVDCPRPGR